ncbi:hypothetical protein PENTCL1PPCAC_10629 [Pristionchus entomophagus]|uniref:G protein-coupled receptor n=1 Tax=Pristionchus entomophagus TaxID=358040 RepID=A0AAV5T4E1_9BILA|nr:hypothetical protein PENTCL1PPCAC_10629 [Pristionchus entomophagus]
MVWGLDEDLFASVLHHLTFFACYTYIRPVFDKLGVISSDDIMHEEHSIISNSLETLVVLILEYLVFLTIAISMSILSANRNMKSRSLVIENESMVEPDSGMPAKA